MVGGVAVSEYVGSDWIGSLLEYHVSGVEAQRSS